MHSNTLLALDRHEELLGLCNQVTDGGGVGWGGGESDTATMAGVYHPTRKHIKKTSYRQSSRRGLFVGKPRIPRIAQITNTSIPKKTSIRQKHPYIKNINNSKTSIPQYLNIAIHDRYINTSIPQKHRYLILKNINRLMQRNQISLVH